MAGCYLSILHILYKEKQTSMWPDPRKVCMPFVLCRAEIFVDATRAMSVVTGEKDNKQVEDKINYSD